MKDLTNLNTIRQSQHFQPLAPRKALSDFSWQVILEIQFQNAGSIFLNSWTGNFPQQRSAPTLFGQ